MSYFDLQHDLNQLAEQQLESAVACNDLSLLGLDRRAASSCWVGEDYIAVAVRDDRTLQYYGGFEYVEKSCRVECGEYVFYSIEDGRVADHHDQFLTNNEPGDGDDVR